MKYVIWNKTQDKFWDNDEEKWSNRYYATKFTIEELEHLNTNQFAIDDDIILAVIVLHI